MADRYPLVRIGGQNATIPAGDALRLRGPLNETTPLNATVSSNGQKLDVDLTPSNTLKLQGNGDGSSVIPGLLGAADGSVRTLYCGDYPLTLRHDNVYSEFLLPGNQNIVMQPGDAATFLRLSGLRWVCIAYQRRDGTALVAPAGGDFKSDGSVQMAGAFNERGAFGSDSGGFTAALLASTNTVFLNAASISSIPAQPVGAKRMIKFTRDCILVNSGQLVLPTRANITAATGDVAHFMSTGSGVWECYAYQRSDGTALVSSGGGSTGPDLTALDLAGTRQMTGGLNEAPITTVFDAVISTDALRNANTLVKNGASLTGLGVMPIGSRRLIQFSGNNGDCTITNSLKLQLPNNQNIIARAGDTAEFLSVASDGTWVCVGYHRNDGTALVAPAAGGTGDFKIDGSVPMTGQLREAPIVTVTATAAMSLQNAASNYVQINGASGAVSLATLGDAPDGLCVDVRFGNVFNGLTLVHSDAVGIMLPGKANITVQLYDRARFRSHGNNIWTCLHYTKADGTAVVSSSSGPASTDALAEGTANLYFTQARTRSTPLTGLATSSAVPLADTDSILAAFGKLQAQVNALGKAFRTENIQATSVGQTTFVVPNGYTPGMVMVFVNGVLLQPEDYTATTSPNVVLAVGADSTRTVVTVGVLSALRTQDDSLLQSTVANLPAASASTAKIRYCTNMAGRPGPVYSDGTNWRRFVDDSVVTT